MLGERQRNIPRHEQRRRTCNRRISVISQFGRFFRTGSHCNRTQWINRDRHYLRRYNFPNDKRRTTDNGLPRHTQYRIYVFQSHRPPGHIFPTVFVPTVRLQWISKNRLRLGISFQKNHHGITFDAAYTALLSPAIYQEMCSLYEFKHNPYISLFSEIGDKPHIRRHIRKYIRFLLSVNHIAGLLYKRKSKKR